MVVDQVITEYRQTADLVGACLTYGVRTTQKGMPDRRTRLGKMIVQKLLDEGMLAQDDPIVTQ